MVLICQVAEAVVIKRLNKLRHNNQLHNKEEGNLNQLNLRHLMTLMMISRFRYTPYYDVNITCCADRLK